MKEFFAEILVVLGIGLLAVNWIYLGNNLVYLFLGLILIFIGVIGPWE